MRLRAEQLPLVLPHLVCQLGHVLEVIASLGHACWGTHGALTQGLPACDTLCIVRRYLGAIVGAQRVRQGRLIFCISGL